MRKHHLIIAFVLFFTNVYSQIDVNATYIKENNSLKFTITNQEERTTELGL